MSVVYGTLAVAWAVISILFAGGLIEPSKFLGTIMSLAMATEMWGNVYERGK